MKISEARLAANRANAAKSTGPRTTEGKAISRLNAFRHGMAGQGDLLGPAEDAAAVAELAAEFERDYGATGKSGRMLAHRAAVLSVRMDRLADRQAAAVAVNVAVAHAQFDDDRRDWLDDEIERVAAGGAAGQVALGVLQTVPEGVLHLLDSGEAIFEELQSTDPAIRAAATARAEHWLGRNEADPARPVSERVRAELIRLDASFKTMGPSIDSIIADRARAGSLARFDASPEALLAQRYEAAAERGMHRALNAILRQNRERRRAQDDDDPAADCATTMAASLDLLARLPRPDREDQPAPGQSVPAPRPDPTQPATRRAHRAQPAPVGSFRVGGDERIHRIPVDLRDDDDVDPGLLSWLKGCPNLPPSTLRTE